MRHCRFKISSKFPNYASPSTYLRALFTHDRCYSYRCHQLPWLLKMAMATGHAVYQIECCICGYHMYHRIWHPIIGEVLGTNRERENEHYRYFVAVLEEETCCVVRHLPHLISRECYFFLRTGGTITAEVTRRQQGFDLHDGGLDIPIAVICVRHCYDFMTCLNSASHILIMQQPVP